MQKKHVAKTYLQNTGSSPNCGEEVVPCSGTIYQSHWASSNSSQIKTIELVYAPPQYSLRKLRLPPTNIEICRSRFTMATCIKYLLLTFTFMVFNHMLEIVEGQETTQVTIPKEMAGVLIGRGGQALNRIRAQSGAYIVVEPLQPGSNERVVSISGTSQSIQMAQYLIQEALRLGQFGR